MSLTKTQQAGGILKFSDVSNISDVSFVKKTYGFIKVRDFQQDSDLKNTIGEMLFKAARLAGIKDEISYDVKADLMKTILGYFKDLSIEEIYKAFELERNCVYDVKTEHFQLFDSQYVSEILKKYKNWKINQKKANNISAPKQEVVVTDGDKDKIRNEYLKSVYDDLKAGNEPSTWMEFKRLEALGMISITDERKKDIYSEEKNKYAVEQRELANIKGFHEGRQILQDLTAKITSLKPVEIVRKRCWSRCVNEYLKDHLEDFETFKKAIN